MKKLVIASGLCMAVSGCIGFSWTSKVDDGAIYELNREMYIAEEDGLILVDARTEHPVYCTIKGTLPAGTKLQEAEKITRFKGSLVDFGEHRQRCPKHGYWYLCPLDCPERNLKCLTPEKYDQEHILNSCGRRGKQ